MFYALCFCAQFYSRLRAHLCYGICKLSSSSSPFRCKPSAWTPNTPIKPIQWQVPLSQSSFCSLHNVWDGLQNTFVVHRPQSCTSAPSHLLKHSPALIFNAKFGCWAPNNVTVSVADGSIIESTAACRTTWVFRCWSLPADIHTRKETASESSLNGSKRTLNISQSSWSAIKDGESCTASPSRLRLQVEGISYLVDYFSVGLVHRRKGEPWAVSLCLQVWWRQDLRSVITYEKRLDLFLDSVEVHSFLVLFLKVTLAILASEQTLST